MTHLIVAVFLLVYLGMIFGGLPFVQLDRAGIALLGAIALVATESVSIEDALRSLHPPTLMLLFSFMVISAQLRLGGFYSWVTRRQGMLRIRPPPLLGAIIAVAAALSAVFSNDIVCLAMAPALVDICLGAGLLLTSRKLHSRHMLGLVDWQILILFIGLFVVNHALQQTGLPAHVVTSLAANGFDLNTQGPLFVAGFLLSNLVSNVPAVMLLLPTASGMQAGTVLALASTLAGNLFIVGSIANIIVVHEAERRGIVIDWRRHARVGVPVTLATLGITGVYLWLRAATP